MFKWEQLENTKGVIRSSKSKKDIQHKGRAKIRLFSLSDALLGLFKFISDYLSYFEKINIFFNIIAKKV
jgi:hypothetical protein